jgi:PAT family acetyl-CoA transporter-like MFS transporter 1
MSLHSIITFGVVDILRFVGILLIAKIGFITNDAVSAFKLLEKGFKEEDLALTVLINFPLQIFFGYYAAKWSQGKRRLLPWLYAFGGRLVMSIVGMWVVSSFPADGVTDWYFFLVVSSATINSFMR